MSDVDVAALIGLLKAAPPDLTLYEACRTYQHGVDGSGNYDPETNGEFEILRAAIPGRRVVVDVGAQRGNWIKMVLGLNPGLQIHAFEPDPRNLATLRATHFPPPASVTIEPVALGAAVERRELWTYGEHTELTSLYRRQTLERFPIEAATSAGVVTLTTLDLYCRDHGVDHIHYLKIDTEGHDLKVLQGARQLLAASAIDVAQFEYGASNIDSHDLLKDFFAFFEDLPYGLFKIHPTWVATHPRYDWRLETFAYQNWIAVRQR
jgi:FkbM family methyltransferase